MCHASLRAFTLKIKENRKNKYFWSTLGGLSANIDASAMHGLN